MQMENQPCTHHHVAAFQMSPWNDVLLLHLALCLSLYNIPCTQTVRTKHKQLHSQVCVSAGGNSMNQWASCMMSLHVSYSGPLLPVSPVLHLSAGDPDLLHLFCTFPLWGITRIGIPIPFFLPSNLISVHQCYLRDIWWGQGRANPSFLTSSTVNHATPSKINEFCCLIWWRDATFWTSFFGKRSVVLLYIKVFSMCPVLLTEPGGQYVYLGSQRHWHTRAYSWVYHRVDTQGDYTKTETSKVYQLQTHKRRCAHTYTHIYTHTGKN